MIIEQLPIFDYDNRYARILMKYKTFERLPGDSLPVIGFGCWSIEGEWNHIKDKESIQAIRTAIDLRITFFDTAPVYGIGHSETILGQGIKGIIHQILSKYALD